MTNDYYFDPRAAQAYDAETGASRPVVRDDVPFYVRLALEARDLGAGVLELGCGTGRVTIPIARAGIPIVGLDSSPAMLEVARRKAPDRENPRWVAASMADFTLPERFGLVIIPFRSFQLLLSVEDQRACLARVHEHLVAGGRLAFNIANPAVVLRASWINGRGGVTEPAPGVESRLIVRLKRNLRLRYVFRAEIDRLLSDAGFAVEALYGWFDGRPFEDRSSEMVWLARRNDACHKKPLWQNQKE